MSNQNEYDSRDHHNVLDPQIQASLRTSPVEVILISNTADFSAFMGKKEGMMADGEKREYGTHKMIMSKGVGHGSKMEEYEYYTRTSMTILISV